MLVKSDIINSLIIILYWCTCPSQLRSDVPALPRCVIESDVPFFQFECYVSEPRNSGTANGLQVTCRLQALNFLQATIFPQATDSSFPRYYSFVYNLQYSNTTK
jgi:hypothetical protein